MRDKTEKLTETAQETICVDLTDQFGVALGRQTLDKRTRISELAGQATLFDQPDAEYVLCGVSHGADGSEKLERLSQSTTLGDLDVPEDGIARLRYFPSLKGAR